MSLLSELKQVLRMCGHALSITVHERLDVMEQRRAETDNALLQASVRLAERVRQGARYTVIESPEAGSFDPGLALALWLYSYVPNRRAVVASARAEALLAPLAQAGYETCSLAAGAARPDDVSLTFLDSTGDLRDVRGAVVVTDLPNDLARVAALLRSQGYFWHLVLYQQEAGEPGYYANSTQVVDHVQGRVLFFRDSSLFARAETWCAALLNRTYFRPGAFS